jgi:N-formylglutamate amidohydrolase
MQIVTYDERLLVQQHRGTLPVILTAPHGGSTKPAQVSLRKETETPAGCDFETNRDNETASITAAVAQKLLDLTGLSPYVVIAQFHRRYIDANRSEACAFTDQDALPFYREYHARIVAAVTEVLCQNQGRGFLFDIHGTQVIASDQADIYLGTANGASLPAGFDRRNLFMQHGLHGQLAAARHPTGEGGEGPVFSYRVSPADASVPETSAVSGGFTIQHYGTTINCIQVEIAATVRDDPATRELFIGDLALAVVNFVRRYAPF